MTLGPFLFAAPWALAALAALPALWWLLRATPPPPQRAQFPPTRMLLGEKTEEQSGERAPLWLVLFRALAATLLILAFAKPSLAPTAAEQASAGRTLIVIDDGWTSAPFWSETRAAANAAISEAERAGTPVFMLLTAPSVPARDAGEALTAADARARVNRLTPKPWRPDRADAARRLGQTQNQFDRIVWITDGLNDDGARELATALQRGPRHRAPCGASRARHHQRGRYAAGRHRRCPPRAIRFARARHCGEAAEGRSLGIAGAVRQRRAQYLRPHRLAAGDRGAHDARAHRWRAERRRDAAFARRIGAAVRRPDRSRQRGNQPLLSSSSMPNARSPYAALQRGRSAICCARARKSWCCRTRA
ncbi:MAG: BatA domain-containing protein [Hyphomonadaceae bacterium]